MKKIAGGLIPIGILTFLLLGGGLLHGQDILHDSIMQKVNSLKQLIPAASGQKKYDLVFGVAYEMFDIDNNEALKYAEEAYALALELGDSLQITKSGRLTGQLLRRLGRLDHAITYLTKVLPIAVRNNLVDEEKRILNALATVFTVTADYSNALKYNLNSLRIRELEGNKTEISIALGNIGLVYYKLGNFERALRFYEDALKAKEESMDKLYLDGLMVNIGLCYCYKKKRDFEKAEAYIRNGLEICGKNCTEMLISDAEFGLGLIRFYEERHKEAVNHFEKSYWTAEKIGYKQIQVDDLIFLGRIYLAKKDYESAHAVLSKAEDLATGSGFNHMLFQTYFMLAELYKATKNIEKVVDYQEKYIQLRDSIYNDDLLKNLGVYQAEFEERENRMKISNQNQILLLKEAAINRQRWIIVFVVAVAFLLLLVAALLFRIGRFRKHIAIELDKRVHLRTQELISNRDQLAQAYDERTRFFETICWKLNASLATVKGLNVVSAGKYGLAPEDYSNKFETIAHQMEEVVRMIQKNK